MATIDVLGWKENFVGFSAWGEHAGSDLRKRLRRGLNASPSEMRCLTRQIGARQPVCLQNVKDEAVDGLGQMLEAQGAEFRVSIDGSDPNQPTHPITHFCHAP